MTTVEMRYIVYRFKHHHPHDFHERVTFYSLRTTTFIHTDNHRRHYSKYHYYIMPSLESICRYIFYELVNLWEVWQSQGLPHSLGYHGPFQSIIMFSTGNRISRVLPRGRCLKSSNSIKRLQNWEPINCSGIGNPNIPSSQTTWHPERLQRQVSTLQSISSQKLIIA